MYLTSVLIYVPIILGFSWCPILIRRNVQLLLMEKNTSLLKVMFIKFWDCLELQGKLNFWQTNMSKNLVEIILERKVFILYEQGWQNGFARQRHLTEISN